MLDEDGDEALERSVDRPVQNCRPVLGVVLADVGEVESRRRVVIELDGAELPLAPDAVGDLEVDLRAVKRAIARLQLVRTSQRVERAAKERLGAIPQDVIADPLRRTGREVRGVLEAHRAVHLVHERHEAFHFVGHLRLQTVDVRVILCELPHASEAAQCP